MGRIWEWVKEHPWTTAIAVFVVGVLIYLLFFRSSGAQAAAPNPYDAYYGALANSTASGNSLAAAQDATRAATAQTQIQADAATQIAKYQADVLAGQTAGAVAIANRQADSADTLAGLMAAFGIQQSNNAAAVAFDQTNSANFLATQAGITSIATTAANTGRDPNSFQGAFEALANQNLLNQIIAKAPNGQSAIAGFTDYAKVAGPGQSSPSFGMPVFTGGYLPGGGTGGGANNGTVAVLNGSPAANTTRSLIDRYGYDPRTFNSYG